MATWKDTICEAARQRGAQWFLERAASLPDALADKTTGTIKNLQISPVKAFGMLALQNARVGQYTLQTADGLFGDRDVMLVTSDPSKHGGESYDYARLSQRECPHLVLAKPTIKNQVITYEASIVPEKLVLEPSMLRQRDGEPVRILMSPQTGEIVTGVLENGPITAWARTLVARMHSRVHPEKVHAVVRDATFWRPVDDMHACGRPTETHFSDGGQVTVASLSTLKEMNNDMAHRRKIVHEAFRMNVLLAGLPSCAEYFVGSITIRGDKERPIAMLFGGLCTRCAVPTVDPQTGLKPDAQPSQWLFANLPSRPGEPKSMTFGVNCVFGLGTEGATMTVGTEFVVTSDKE